MATVNLGSKTIYTEYAISFDAITVNFETMKAFVNFFDTGENLGIGSVDVKTIIGLFTTEEKAAIKSMFKNLIIECYNNLYEENKVETDVPDEVFD